MSFFINIFFSVFFFFVLFGLQSAHAFSFFGVQPNVFLLFSVAFVLFLPFSLRGFFFLFFFHILFLFFVRFFFPFFLFEVAFYFLFLLVLFLAKRFFSGTFAVDFFASLFFLFLYFVFLGAPEFSKDYVILSFLSFLATCALAFVFWYICIERTPFLRHFFHERI